MAVQKRKFFDVNIEILNASTQVLAFNHEDLKGKMLRLDLSRFLKGKSSEGKFIITKKDDNLIATMESFEMPLSYIRKLIGHGTSIVEDSFVVNCSDGKLRIKPFLITRQKVHRSVRSSLRKIAKQEIISFTLGKTKQQIFNAVLDTILQKTILKKLKKIYPLGVCELRAVQTLKK